MRIRFLALLPFVIASFAFPAFSFSSNYIEFNLTDKEIKLVDFKLGGYSLSGDFSVEAFKDQGSLIYEVEGRDIILSLPQEEGKLNSNSRIIPWFSLKTVKRGKMIFIEHFSIPQGSIKGNLNLSDFKFSLDINGEWDADTKNLQGPLKIFAKAWGSINNFSLSGYLTMDDGIYKDRNLSHMRLDFLGKPPLLNITDSEFILKTGTVAAIAGDKVLDLRDFANFSVGKDLKVRKVFIDEWQLFSEGQEGLGLKKSLDGNIDVSLEAGQEDSSGPQTQLRYNIKDDKFLKVKMQENSTLIGLEKRKDF